jgi:hypothetical protein
MPEGNIHSELLEAPQTNDTTTHSNKSATAAMSLLLAALPCAAAEVSY